MKWQLKFLSGYLGLLLLLAFLLLGFATARAQEQASSPVQEQSLQQLSSSTSEPKKLPIGSWESWDVASQDFKAGLTMLVNYWETFNPLLEKLGISFEDFPAYMIDLTAQLKSSEEAIAKERESSNTIITAEVSRRINAETARDRWRILAVSGTVLAVAGIIYVLAK